MGKYADRHFVTEEMAVAERGFDPAYAGHAESVFSLGNEYMGVRGYFDEGYSGEHLQGSYFNGIYEFKPTEGSAYKGIASGTEYMVNSVDWLYTRIYCGGEQLDLAHSQTEDFEQRLDFRDGVLTRSFIWKTRSGHRIRLAFERLLSMEKTEYGAQRITAALQAEAGAGAGAGAEASEKSAPCILEIRSGLELTVIHKNEGRSLWVTDGCSRSRDIRTEYQGTADRRRAGQGTDDQGTDDKAGKCGILSIWGHTLHTGMRLKSIARIRLSGDCSGEEERLQHEGLQSGEAACNEEDRIQNESLQSGECEGRVYISVNSALTEGRTLVLEKTVRNIAIKTAAETDSSASDSMEDFTFDELRRFNAAWWQKTWKRADIVIEGDPENQQGIRFCIFQLFQTYHGAVPGANIGAKGLTGEAYNGNAFWDTETYCLPFYLWNDEEAARNLLLFRYKTLPQARERAKALDCRGAFYPIATISGRECCNLWQHASLQLQASTAVAYGIWLYEKMYGDRDFLYRCGLEMLVEISRMLASRGAYDPEGNFGFYGVMGPDEFQMMVNHNCYTNYMGRFTLQYTLDCLKDAETDSPQTYRDLCGRLGIGSGEKAEWENIVKHMYIPYDAARRLFEQHDGYFRLPHVDIRSIPAEEFPLYSHWSYDRIYRNDMIKQPDVLMFMLLFNSSFTNEELKSNYEFYEPRCIHESSLSPSVHSILAEQLGRTEEAFDFFKFATRMDLDNYNRNSAEGIHTTSIAAAWMNIVYGFGGLRCDGEHVCLSPRLPKEWKGYSFMLNRNDWSVLAQVGAAGTKLTCSGKCPNDLYLYGHRVVWDNSGCYERKRPSDETGEKKQAV